MALKAKKFIYASEFEGEPKETDFELKEEELPALEDGDILVEAIYTSVDPYYRIFDKTIGKTMIGGQIAKIIESKCEEYPEGSYIFASIGWSTHTVFKPFLLKGLFKPVYLLPDFEDLSLSLGLGILGMPGNTAYFGFLEICKPKEGETLVVSGAAGAVGSLVGQIGKIKGLKVIGIAGSNDKCKWLTNELGFDHAINYKTANVAEALKKTAPDGIDCYFDNVGGQITSTVIQQMNYFGRISVCGSISVYNTDLSKYPQVPCSQISFVTKELKMEGFLVSRWNDRWLEGIEQMLEWIKEGKIKYRETLTEGFEKMPKAFIDMLRGRNIGKAVIKV